MAAGVAVPASPRNAHSRGGVVPILTHSELLFIRILHANSGFAVAFKLQPTHSVRVECLCRGGFSFFVGF